MSKSEALIIKGEDWEGLFINGKKVDENRRLEQGQDRILYIRKQSKKFDFDIYKLKFGITTEEYDDYLYSVGEFHEDLNDIQYNLMEEPN